MDTLKGHWPTISSLILYSFNTWHSYKGFLKVILQYKNEVPPLQKWARNMHNEIVAINAKLQVSVQILLYNKK